MNKGITYLRYYVHSQNQNIPITSINRIFGITPLSPTGNHNICKIYHLCAKKLIIILYLQ